MSAYSNRGFAFKRDPYFVISFFLDSQQSGFRGNKQMSNAAFSTSIDRAIAMTGDPLFVFNDLGGFHRHRRVLAVYAAGPIYIARHVDSQAGINTIAVSFQLDRFIGLFGESTLALNMDRTLSRYLQLAA